MEQVIVLRMVNGEEVIARLVDENDVEFRLKSPRVLQLQFLPNGQMNAQLIPLVLQSNVNDVCTVFKTAVAVVVDTPSVEHEKRYLGVVSGIQLAQ